MASSQGATLARSERAEMFFLDKDDLVSGSLNTTLFVRESYLYDRNDGPLVFAGFLIRVSSESRFELQPDFLAYYVQSKR